MSIKFKFYLKRGKVFECIEELSAEQFKQILDFCRITFRDNNSGVLRFEDCCVRLPECGGIVEWEVLE